MSEEPENNEDEEWSCHYEKELPEEREINYAFGLTQKEVGMLYEVGRACQKFLDDRCGRQRSPFSYGRFEEKTKRKKK